MAYRVPRRFIVPPQDPPPYGLFGLSFLAHAMFMLLAGGLSAYVQAQADQQKIYIVNLVPAAAPLGTPAPAAAPPAPPPPPAPKVEERSPPRATAVEPPRPKETPPPKPNPVDDLPPPRTRETAKEIPRSELALPKKVEKETPALDTPAAREKLIARAPLPPPAPLPTARTPEPSRVTTPAPPPPPTVATARPTVPPIPLGRPDAAVPTTGSISLDVSDFPFTYYLRQLQAKISERWAPPRGQVAGGERVIVLFEIGRDGQIKEPAVERSSGNAIYDQSALRAVMEASPFPPLPPEFKAASLKVHFGFEFKPEQG